MHFLAFADIIAVVEGGRISHLGSYEALESQVLAWGAPLLPPSFLLPPLPTLFLLCNI